MHFELPELPYEITALEPYVSAKTLEFHYGKHHKIYLTNLNSLIRNTRFENADIKTIIKEADGPLFNNAAQVWNHTFYFTGMRTENSYLPNGEFSDAMNNRF